MTVNLPAGGTVQAKHIGGGTTEFVHTNAEGRVTSTVYLKGDDADDVLTTMHTLRGLTEDDA